MLSTTTHSLWLTIIYLVIDIGPRYKFDSFVCEVYERRVRSNTQFGICNFQDTLQGKANAWMNEKMAICHMISIKGHVVVGLLHEEDGKCLILKISASGKNEDITC